MTQELKQKAIVFNLDRILTTSDLRHLISDDTTFYNNFFKPTSLPTIEQRKAFVKEGEKLTPDMRDWAIINLWGGRERYNDLMTMFTQFEIENIDIYIISRTNLKEHVVNFIHNMEIFGIKDENITGKEMSIYCLLTKLTMDYNYVIYVDYVEDEHKQFITKIISNELATFMYTPGEYVFKIYKFKNNNQYLFVQNNPDIKGIKIELIMTLQNKIIDTSLKQKYLKYKTKYLQLKSKLTKMH